MPGEPYSSAGREAEFREIEEFVDAVGDGAVGDGAVGDGAVGGGAVALLLEGELGIGKTTLWRQGVSAASARGYRVLACQPAQCETGLAYAALGDLLADVPDEALVTLPA